jgi:hydroxymethylglutaryl-CoA reductase (NADPH)
MAVGGVETDRVKVPRDPSDDYTRDAAAMRRGFAREQTGADLSHVGAYSFDPSTLPGNIENFMGAAEVPLGLAGPLRINGEHAQGDFYIPLATSEGTLVASYNRGMRLLTEPPRTKNVARTPLASSVARICGVYTLGPSSKVR